MTALLLHPDDNVLVAISPIAPGAIVTIDGATVIASQSIDVGHKLARRPLEPGDKVIKHGAAIGSMTHHVAPGDHVHLHNMKSDYIATHARDTLERSIP